MNLQQAVADRAKLIGATVQGDEGFGCVFTDIVKDVSYDNEMLTISFESGRAVSGLERNSSFNQKDEVYYFNVMYIGFYEIRPN